MYLETDETRAMTGVTERRDNKGSGLFALGSESDSNDDDNNGAEKIGTWNINNKEDKFETFLFLPSENNLERYGEGGLRKKIFLKILILINL